MTRLTATSSQTVGPFFNFGLARDASLGCLVRPDTPGDHITLRITVLDGDRAPVPDALIELWQADASGVYARPQDPAGAPEAPGFCGFGRLATGADGISLFTTVRPGRVPDGQGGWQAPHINVCLFARGLLRQVYTRIYLAEGSELESDPILALVPPARRETLVAHRADSSTWTFDIKLQGEHETVFFDL
jgi:protocatechuate 3,4-dioxygenase, alpha subunit